MALLEIDDLSVGFDRSGRTIPAVRHVSLTIAPRCIVGLVGESGSGKSTLALAILRLLAPNARIGGGTIRYRGTDLLGLPAPALRALRGERIAVVFQDPMNSLNPVIPIGTQMIDVQFRRSTSRRQKREHAASMLRSVGIADPERRMRDVPHAFSGGMRQRIAIAMALSCAPDLLIADEPTTALDATLEAQILELLRDLCRDVGASVLLVTHHLGVVAELCDDVAVMYAGELVETGTVAAVFRHPAHPYTQALLECDPSRLALGATVFPTIPGRLPDPAAPRVGCAFAPRCPSAIAICHDIVPAWQTSLDGHAARCHRAALA